MSANLLGKQRHLFYVQFFKLDHWLTQKNLSYSYFELDLEYSTNSTS